MTEAKIDKIYVSRESAGPILSKQSARLLPGKGIDGDRYALGTGTYSATFMSEPGKHLTMISLEGIREATERTGMKAFDDMGELRRNLVLSGISAQELNGMIGHEVKIGRACRVFVHRRCVPCKLREAACKRPGLMNNLWGVSGVNCEVLEPLEAHVTEINVGDAVVVLPDTYQPERIDVGRKKPGWATRPIDRSAEDVKKMITPTWIAAIACLIDPKGFHRVENAYTSVGMQFWTSDAYTIGLLLQAVRLPLLAVLFVALLSIVIGIYLNVNGIEI
eukprot:CAMPEP_0116118824 /NCGR_PEP_ID=MMETSP0329-20121206/2313_1 /TAXON_ID=697910 /ORGANISM="Pseudo-nitzschia arenysensis, Strain B593" /LENGTH=276 /DNA_ID=CAMNT_0003612483 /DNA_START=9 /DNA_END=839 /DNA_ORIENTATION=+